MRIDEGLRLEAMRLAIIKYDDKIELDKLLLAAEKIYRFLKED